jgi:hypothetical protein
VSINALTSVPQNVVLTTGNGQNYLAWQQVVGALGYTVQRSLTGLVGSFNVVFTSPVTNFLDTTVTPGTQYWYQIASTNASGTSSFNSLGTNDLPLTIVPCLPGQINLGYLRYMSKLRADKLMSQFLTDDEWNFNINQTMKRLYDVLVTKFGDMYFLAPPLQMNLPASGIVPIPDGSLYGGAAAQYKLSGIDIGINGNNNQWFTLPRFNWVDRNKYATLQLAGTIQSVYGLQYCENGSNIYFIPPPNGGQTIQLWYVPIVSELLQDIDMMPFSISGWSELVIVDAAIKALIKEESYEQAQALINERSDLIERIETTAANRDVGQPNTVSNTRSRAGDPNFGNWGGFMGGSGSTGWGC